MLTGIIILIPIGRFFILSPNKKTPSTFILSNSVCLVYLHVFDHREGRPLAGRLLVGCPWPPYCALESLASTSTTLLPRSIVEQRPRLSLANPNCSGGIITFKGSTI